MSREQVHATTTQPGKDAAGRSDLDDTIDQAVADAADRAAQDTLDATDELLDEIDDLLEVNAEEFVRNYVQKGGQ
jgi:ubiquitin-like protein Pup